MLPGWSTFFDLDGNQGEGSMSHLVVTTEAEFCDFVANHSPRLLRSANLLMDDWAAAEDLVQQVLIKTYLSWDKVRQADHPTAYAQRMLYNSASRVRRQNSSRRLRLAGLRDAVAVPSPEQGVTDRDEVAQLLSQLSTKQRIVLLLRFYEDLSVEESARVLGCSAGTIKSQTAKALAKLRSCMSASMVND